MRALAVALSLSLLFLSRGAAAIPPALPGDDESYAETFKQAQQNSADLDSPEARSLIQLFFERIVEGEPFVLAEIFTKGASHTDLYGETSIISDRLDSEGFPDIRQWEAISMFRLTNTLGVAAQSRLQPVGINQAVLKFSFSRDASGALRISRIEEIDLG